MTLQVDIDYEDYTERHRDMQFDLEWDEEYFNLLEKLCCEETPYIPSICGQVLIGKNGMRIKDNREEYRKARRDYDDSIKYDGYWDVMETIL